MGRNIREADFESILLKRTEALLFQQNLDLKKETRQSLMIILATAENDN